jgi:hypothetical protein
VHTSNVEATVVPLGTHPSSRFAEIRRQLRSWRRDESVPLQLCLESPSGGGFL